MRIHRLQSILLAACVGVPLTILACGHDGGHADHATSGLRLDEGQKWQTDPATRAAAAEMMATVGSDPEPNVEAYRALGVALDRQSREMISGCTMTGPAHANLHAFLGGYIPVISTLAGAGSLDEGRDALARVRAQLALYREHFE